MSKVAIESWCRFFLGLEKALIVCEKGASNIKDGAAKTNQITNSSGNFVFSEGACIVYIAAGNISKAYN